MMDNKLTSTICKQTYAEMEKFYSGLLTKRGIMLATIGRLEELYGVDAVRDAIKQKLF